jgi:hypothetical protein
MYSTICDNREEFNWESFDDCQLYLNTTFLLQTCVVVSLSPHRIDHFLLYIYDNTWYSVFVVLIIIILLIISAIVSFKLKAYQKAANQRRENKLYLKNYADNLPTPFEQIQDDGSVNITDSVVRISDNTSAY